MELISKFTLQLGKSCRKSYKVVLKQLVNPLAEIRAKSKNGFYLFVNPCYKLHIVYFSWNSVIYFAGTVCVNFVDKTLRAV